MFFGSFFPIQVKICYEFFQPSLVYNFVVVAVLYSKRTWSEKLIEEDEIIKIKEKMSSHMVYTRTVGLNQKIKVVVELKILREKRSLSFISLFFILFDWLGRFFFKKKIKLFKKLFLNKKVKFKIIKKKKFKHPSLQIFPLPFSPPKISTKNQFPHTFLGGYTKYTQHPWVTISYYILLSSRVVSVVLLFCAEVIFIKYLIILVFYFQNYLLMDK